ncbi:hypothetical protein [Anaerosalibacter massiliensis]|uniref:Uncharacterized protein n=1 Tax=Anaerosalibacter massiliensis TaxID=1347392 RepID=A0A9X2S817_9FIRM|nr:hypothetical protein [Anaerosalibacter massiliensis]MCR2044626.1 hypothetical protein [Anaerosalibacter massiliensis]
MEVGKVLKKGIKIWKENMPIKESIVAISKILDINPYGLIYSDNMSIVVEDKKISIIKERVENGELLLY